MKPPQAPSHAAATSAAIELPLEPRVTPRERHVVARGLANPRGMYVAPNGTLWVSEAGTGDEQSASGRISELSDHDGDGDYLDAGESRVLLDHQPSKNILEIVRRDEVFGMAGMATGAGDVLVALAFFGGPSTVFKIGTDGVQTWSTTHGNINDLTYDPSRKHWFAVSSTTDEVVQLQPGEGAARVVKLPPLPSGQDAVPGYLSYDPLSRELLVSLFSGSPEGEEGGKGVEIVPRAGAIVGVEPDSKRVTPVVRGLTVPTDLEIDAAGIIYVLEFCDAFLDPVPSREALWQGVSHGGFRRFSGRLFRIDRGRSEVTLLAEGLDAPTNLALAGSALYVAEGMGTPGRQIPGPNGPQQLDGFIERIDLGGP